LEFFYKKIINFFSPIDLKKQIHLETSASGVGSFKKIRIENAAKEDEGIYECRAYFVISDKNVNTFSKTTRIIIGKIVKIKIRFLSLYRKNLNFSNFKKKIQMK
jgi:acyl-ACP thioesterase